MASIRSARRTARSRCGLNFTDRGHCPFACSAGTSGRSSQRAKRQRNFALIATSYPKPTKVASADAPPGSERVNALCQRFLQVVGWSWGPAPRVVLTLVASGKPYLKYASNKARWAMAVPGWPHGIETCALRSAISDLFTLNVSGYRCGGALSPRDFTIEHYTDRGARSHGGDHPGPSGFGLIGVKSGEWSAYKND